MYTLSVIILALANINMSKILNVPNECLYDKDELWGLDLSIEPPYRGSRNYHSCISHLRPHLPRECQLNEQVVRLEWEED